MSTNPSFVNGEEVMPGNTVKLKDGDSIMVGKTVLLLRYAMLS
jgi:pSer/pThr/pTyr-binding forkhead associated (FHA) protein